MIPTYLRLKGWKGIKLGMGLDELALDFSGISGLIEFEGPNGMGKTTVLENLHPYRTLFSRQGSLNKHCLRRDSEKEYSFLLEGHLYRTLLKIDADSDRGEGFIWVDDDPTPVVDGKRTAYDRFILDLLGSDALFQNSAFCPQGAVRFTDLRTAAIRELFSEFLRLGRYVVHDDTSKQCLNIFTGRMNAHESRLKALEEKISGIQAVKDKLGVLRNEVNAGERDREGLLEELRQILSSIESTKLAVQRNEGLRQREKDLVKTIEDLKVELDKEKKAAEAEINTLKIKYREISSDLEKVNAVLAVKDEITAAAEKEKAITLELDELAPKIEQVGTEISDRQARVTALDQDLASRRQSLRDLDNDPQSVSLKKESNDLAGQLAEVTRLLAQLDKDAGLAKINAEIKQCQELIKSLSEQSENCNSPKCSLFISATAARDQLPSFEAARDDLLKIIEQKRSDLNGKAEFLGKTVQELAQRTAVRLQEVNNEKSAIQGRLARLEFDQAAETTALSAVKKSLETCRKRIQVIREEMKKVRDLASKQSEIQVALSRKNDLDRRLAEVTEDGTRLRRALDEKVNDRNEYILEQEKILTAVRNEIDIEADERLSKLQATHDETTKKVAETDRTIRSKQEELIIVQREIDMAAVTEKEILSVKDSIRIVNREIADWMYIRNACSKTGLQALELEGVCPAIVNDTNNLLIRTYGPNFTIKIQTLDEQGKEVFRVWVLRGDGTKELLEEYSGGEKVWIAKAMRLAMTLLAKDKSGRNLETAYGDEEDGALDVENAKNYYALLRSFMEIGKFQNFFFISHKRESRAFADHVLSFRPGGVTWN